MWQTQIIEKLHISGERKIHPFLVISGMVPDWFTTWTMVSYVEENHQNATSIAMAITWRFNPPKIAVEEAT